MPEIPQQLDVTAAPGQDLELLLSSGGDTRLDIDASTGRSRYLCTPRPSDAVPFGSCTASSVSRRGFAAAEAVRRQARAWRDHRLAAEEVAEAIRRRLADLFCLPADVDVVLAPSGTDTELLALVLATGGHTGRMVSVLVGPHEVGGGTPLAAACRHYDRRSPSGRRVELGAPVDRPLATRVDLRKVVLRTAEGTIRTCADLEAEVSAAVAAAKASRATVLLHVVAHSKTGVHAPSLEHVEHLLEANNHLVVLLDAAQGRLSRRRIRKCLEAGFLVTLTGSKFYGGPPFSGALLVPARFRPSERGIRRLPRGFGAYFSTCEMPPSWHEVRQTLPAEPNWGTLLRWIAALADIDAYYALPRELRFRILRSFEEAVPSVLADSQAVELLTPYRPPVEAEDGIERTTTVFSFFVGPPHRWQRFDEVRLRGVYAELASDLSATDAGADPEIVGRQYHVGQPVEFAGGAAVLRVAVGGELVTRIAGDESLGASLDARLAWLRKALEGLCRKIEHLAKRRAAGSVAS